MTARRNRFGPLSVLALVFVSASLLKLTSSGQVLAEGLAPEKPEPAAEVADECQPAVPAEMIAAIQSRERELAAREEDLSLRLIELDDIETQVNQRLAELRAAEEKLSETLSIADSAAEQDLARMTAIYENMKPEQAASVFETMNVDFAAGFLARMKPAAAAAVLASLPPEFAYAISVVVAGRNARAPG